MTPKEAIQQAKKKTVETPAYVVSFGYDKKFLLPHKAAVQLIDVLAQGEFYECSYNNDAKIRPIDQGDYELFPLSAEKILNIRTANLMHISVPEFEAALTETT